MVAPIITPYGKRAAAVMAVANRIVAPQGSRLVAFHAAWTAGGAGTVARGVAACIAGIYVLWGPNGQRNIHSIFTSAAATKLMRRSNGDVAAHTEIATMEWNYWRKEDARESDFYTKVAVRVTVGMRVGLQQSMGTIVSVEQIVSISQGRLSPRYPGRARSSETS